MREETEKLMESAKIKVDLEKLTHDDSLWLSFSFLLSFKSYIIIASITMIGLTLVCMYYCEYFSLGCLCNILKKEMRSECIKLRSGVRKSKKQYRKTPYVVC